MPSDPEVVLRLLANLFETLRVPFVVGGSIASSVYGIPRATQDVDILLALENKHVPLFFQTLEKSFYIDLLRVQEAVKIHGSFSVIHLETMLKVDFFVAGHSAWTEEEIKRTRQLPLSESSTLMVHLSSPEDNILHKLRWFQMGGRVSEKQWSDVQGILKVQQSQLDYAYLHKWADQLGIAVLLEDALKEAGISPNP